MRTRALIAVGLCLVFANSVSSEWGEPVNLGSNINTFNGIEYYPCISADGTKLYFTTPHRVGGFGDDDIWVSAWDGSEWGTPVNAGSNVNSAARDLSPSVSSDGMKLYFVSWGRPGGYGSYDIWVSSWEDSMWGPASNVGPNINTASMEWSVSISPDGSKLYFASDRPGGFGDMDLWVSQWAGSQWGSAENLGPNVNTYAQDESPCVSSDDETLYFSRWILASEMLDIYVSQWEGTEWGAAQNLGSPINTPTWDDGPSISVDGDRLYFASSRDTSRPAVQDIWVSQRTPGVAERADRTIAGEEMALLPPRPLPFSSLTSIRFSVSTPQRVELVMLDAGGAVIKTLVKDVRGAGIHEILWDGTSDEGAKVSSGIYFCSFRVGGYRQTTKLVLLK